MRATETRNQEGEHIGALNRVSKVAYRGRMAMKALEKAQRKLYYAVEYAVLGGILAAFIVWA